MSQFSHFVMPVVVQLPVRLALHVTMAVCVHDWVVRSHRVVVRFVHDFACLLTSCECRVLACSRLCGDLVMAGMQVFKLYDADDWQRLVVGQDVAAAARTMAAKLLTSVEADPAIVRPETWIPIVTAMLFAYGRNCAALRYADAAETDRRLAEQEG